MTELVFILDRSGSMAGLEADTIGGFNSMIARQKQETGEALVSTVLFDNESVVIHDRLPLAKVPLMTEKEYFTRGCTALLDAVGGAIHHIGSIHKYARREDVPEKTLFVITTDGSISDIPREDYLEPEERVIRELQELGKPFIVLLNSEDPKSDRTLALAGDIASRYQVKCVPVNCLRLEEEDVGEILKAVLYEFPMRELDIFLPPWVDALPGEHPVKAGIYDAIRQSMAELHHIREIDGAVKKLGENENISEALITAIDLGTGVAAARVSLPREMFYRTLSEQSGFDVGDDGDLMSLLTKLAGVKTEYDKVAGALRDVRETGYGIVVPGIDELKLEEPEIMKQGGRYGVRLKASAPSIHMIRADIETAVSPIVGNEKQSEDMVNYLLQEFEGDTSKIWQSNIFGRSFHEVVSDDLQTKLKRMPEDARKKLQETLTRIINEGSGGLICIIL